MLYRRLTQGLSCAAVSLLFLAACGGDDGEDVEPEEADTAEEADAPVEDSAGDDSGDLELAVEGQILVGAGLSFPPFGDIVDGEPTGFDVDVMREITSRLGLELEYQQASFDVLLTQLAAGEFDATMSATTITEERREIVDFTEPYFAANQALVVATGSDVTGVADLAGMVIGAQAGTTGLSYAEETFTDSEVRGFDTYPAAFTALEAGQIDAVIGDLPVASEQSESPGLELVEEIETGEYYGIAVPQESPNLRDALSEQIAAIVEDGTYERIYTSWFEGDVPEPFRQ